MTQDCTNCVNPAKSDVIWADFRRWTNSRSWELTKLCYKAAHKRFHDKLSRIIDPLVDMFTPKPPPTPKAEQDTKVTPPLETEIAIVSGTKPMVEDERIPLVLKTLK